MSSVMKAAWALALALVVAQAPGQVPAAAAGSAPEPAPVPAPVPDPADAPPLDLTRPTLFVVGYAHLDTQWRWTYADTIREFIPATLKRNFALFEKYPDYVFNFGGSRRYEMMREYYPDDFEKLKNYVKAGRWFPCGSSVDENDANVPSAESQIRHVLYGNRFFRAEFGVASDEFMLPDCFGFPASAAQRPGALRHPGLLDAEADLERGRAHPLQGRRVGGAGRPLRSSPRSTRASYVGEVRDNLANDDGWYQRIDEQRQAVGRVRGLPLLRHRRPGRRAQGALGRQGRGERRDTATADARITSISGPADALFNAISRADARPSCRATRASCELTRALGRIDHVRGVHEALEPQERAARRRRREAPRWPPVAGRPAVSRREAPRTPGSWCSARRCTTSCPGRAFPTPTTSPGTTRSSPPTRSAPCSTDAAASVISGARHARDGMPGATCVVVYNPLVVERQDVVEADVPVDGRPAPASV